MMARLGARVAITSTTDRIEERADEIRAEGAEVSRRSRAHFGFSAVRTASTKARRRAASLR